MTPNESREALISLHFEYMNHSSKERLELYEEYRAKRNKIMEQLKKYQQENEESKVKMK